MKRLACALVLLLVACGPPRAAEPEPLPKPTPMHALPLDDSPKEESRLVPAEVYMKSFLQIFGDLNPLAGQVRARGNDGSDLFDSWDEYFSSLGLPDYRLDLPRSQRTNALMVATFERVGVALCDRAVEHDLKGVAFAEPPVPASLSTTPASIVPPKPAPKPPAPKGPPPLNERIVFVFDTGDPSSAEAFAPKFDVLHRTFLGYPAKLAETDRTTRFFGVYSEVKRHHASLATTPTTFGSTRRYRFSPTEAAWASVCYGLVRHPEFHLY